ncbi:hypothetical protein ANANG_G00253870 [Anguilla anguilla]|uniref:Ubiquitin-conjugating enzyme E2 C n=1 Tax=Anguilla anguilla TaxID=7936 RepID=A0A9D3RQU1_ANGAN|nr:hypothetical protein ANANG_G00253870 [Anguilla anguilla]
MASQNMDPAAATSTAALKGSETGGSAARGSVSKRLQQELMTLMMSGDKGISAFPESDNLFKWIGTIDGAQERGYPYKAPRVKFITPCYHPNVDEHGFICLDILKEKWSALYDVRSILLSIQSLLGEPNNDSPMNAGAAVLWDDQEATSTAALKGSETGGSAARGSVSKRLQQELMTLMMSGDKGISAFPESDNLFKWIGTIDGAQGTVYEGLRYKLSLEFPSGYPYKAPRVKFITPCYHPNVDEHGFICLDILKEKWSALYDVRSILLSIQSLLGEPNNDSPMNAGAAVLWDDQEAYKARLHATYKN